MAIRNEFNVFILGRCLFQQWLVDSYVKIEKDRINYCKDHQKELRTETYQGLRDYIQTMANNSNRRIGKMIILPFTFIGSPRNMLQNYQDLMEIVVSKFGKPDLFITITCNLKWRKIKGNLLIVEKKPQDKSHTIAMLCAEDKSLANFPQMEQLIENVTKVDYMTLEKAIEISTRQYEQLNDKQKESLSCIKDDRLDINTHDSNGIYINDPGGLGKTFIYTTIYYLANIQNKQICTMDFTDIATT